MRNVFDQVPAVLLGMMGVDEEYQSAGLGADLLCDAILNASEIANLAGARTLVVDPADEDAAGFTSISASLDCRAPTAWRSASVRHRAAGNGGYRLRSKTVSLL